MAYFARTDVETFLNISLNPSGQSLIDALIPALEARANRYCNRSWNLSGNQIETFNGGQRTYLVSNPPMTSVVSLTVDGTELTAGEDFYVYDSYIQLATPATAGLRNVVITYQTSSSNLPADVKHALVQWAAQIFKAAEDGGKVAKRVKFGQADVEYLARDGMPRFVMDVLDSYRLMPV